jgi:hypothetical protein
MPPEDRLYRPFGGVAPTKTQTPALNIPSPDVRFSQSIGQALSDVGERVFRTLGNSQIQVGAALAHMGDTFEHVGDDLFRRASAIKAVENETAAIEADTKFRIEADKRTDAFRDQTKASGAVGSLEAHMKGLEDVRQQIRATLTNDQSRAHFDNGSLRALGHQMARAGDHAATQGKAAMRASAEAQLKLDLVEIEKDPNRPDAEDMKNRAIETYRNKIRDVDGDVGPTALYKELEINSKYNMAIVKGIARDNPIEADRMLKKFQAEGKVLPEHTLQVENTIKSNQTTIGERMIPGKVTQDMRTNVTPEQIRKEKGIGERVDEARRLAAEDPIMGKDPRFLEGIERATRIKYQAELDYRKDLARRNEWTVQAVIMGAKSPDGKTRPKDFSEFLAMGGDEGKAAFDALPLDKQELYRKKIMSKDYLDSEKVMEEYMYHVGRARDQDESAQREVLDTNYFEKAWPMKYIADMFKRQQEILKGEHRDLHLHHAETVADPALRRAKITKEDNPDAYYKYKGFLEDFIQRYQGITKTYPKDDVIISMTERYTQKEYGGPISEFFGRGHYGFDMPADFVETWKEKHPGQTEADARRGWAETKVIEFYKSFFSKDKIPATLPKEPAAAKWMREHGAID